MLALTWLLVPSPAGAATCTFDAMTATGTVALGDGEAATIVRQGDAIALDGAPCDTATVTNTDGIVVNGTGTPASITIDLGGGPFAPGATTESDGGDAEIEFTINLPAGSPIVRVAGSGGPDTVVVGGAGINLNPAESTDDADVTINGSAAVTVDGLAGQDALSVAGGEGTGAPAAGTLNGGDDDDRLAGATGGSSFDGGAGEDTIDYTGANGVNVDLGAGGASHTGGGTDAITAIENALGSPGNDVVTGTPQANTLSGGDGDDRIDGRAGDDVLDGAADRDTVRFRTSDGGVEVDLRDGTATGDGDDTLAAFENVMGTKKADTIRGDGGRNKLAGGAGGDELLGQDGSDFVTGGPGNDRVNGQGGADALFGRAGRDQLDGGKARDSCNGGPDPDSFVFCERIRLE